MQTLDQLTREAVALANAENKHNIPPQDAPLSDSVLEVSRQMMICNSCRYCEGFCAVFPAMTRRLEFGSSDVHYLANLCHNCGACLHACQYAPPHEFKINVPKAMAQVRIDTYTAYAWPARFGVLYKNNGLWIAMALAIGLTLFLQMTANFLNGANASSLDLSNFYSIYPHNTLVSLFLPIFAFVTFSLFMGVRHFLGDIKQATSKESATGVALTEAAENALTLKYLDGGHGDGCNNEDDGFTKFRKYFHHLTFYGFMLCFSATSVATIYHYLFGWEAPYAWNSLPKALGISGGISLALGCIGLLYLNLKRHPLHGDPSQKPMDIGFIFLLFMTSTTGLLLAFSHQSTSMPLLLSLHLGVVMALFITLPYGKFAHAAFRLAALIRFQTERRLPSNIGLSAE
jgi:citrate/tricarballylate utilization protein